MAGSLNKVSLIGNVGSDPEIRTFASGGEVANFSLATSESWKDKTTGERKEKTEWHRICIYSEPLVKVVRSYVKKGTKLYVEGELKTRKWMDDSAQTHYATEVVLQGYGARLTLLSSGEKKAASDSHGGQVPDTGMGYAVDDDDSIPF